MTEPQNSKSIHSQKLFSASIASETIRFEMLAAVDLNDEFRCVANEIGDVRADRDLPAERCAVQPMGAKNAPYDAFCLGRVFP
jgi:hypothetical protein